MNRVRTLNLKRETLGGLGADELGQVAGGSHFCTVTHTPACNPTDICPTLPLLVCLSETPTVCVCIQTEG